MLVCASPLCAAQCARTADPAWHAPLPPQAHQSRRPLAPAAVTSHAAAKPVACPQPATRPRSGGRQLRRVILRQQLRTHCAAQARPACSSPSPAPVWNAHASTRLSCAAPAPPARLLRHCRATPAPPPRVSFRAACAQTREPGLGLRGSVWVASCREARTWQSQRQRQSTERCREDERERARLERSAGRRRVTSHYGVLRRRGLTSHRTCVLKKCHW